MQRMTMPNFCINFLNKAAKLLSISYDFAVASSSDAWIKTRMAKETPLLMPVASSSDAWIKTYYKGRDNIPLFAGQATVQSVPYTTN